MAMTIRDIAREAGVSTATVSRALRGLPNVDPVTREKVRQVAERLDYVVSPAASRLASGRAGSIAVITPYIARWYFARVLSGIEGVLQASELDLLLSSIGDPGETGHVPPHRKLRRRVDGFLVISLPTETEGVSEIFDLDQPVDRIAEVRIHAEGEEARAARLAQRRVLAVQHRHLHAPGGQFRFQGFGQGEVAGNEPRGAGRTAVARGGLDGRLDEVRVVGQAEVVVGGEV